LNEGQDNETTQAQEIETLYNLMTSMSNTNATVIGSAILTFADNYDMASEQRNVFGDQSETCPDINPYLQVLVHFTVSLL
jgi:hypothetical protein